MGRPLLIACSVDLFFQDAKKWSNTYLDIYFISLRSWNFKFQNKIVTGSDEKIMVFQFRINMIIVVTE